MSTNTTIKISELEAFLADRSCGYRAAADITVAELIEFAKTISHNPEGPNADKKPGWAYAREIEDLCAMYDTRHAKSIRLEPYPAPEAD